MLNQPQNIEVPRPDSQAHSVHSMKDLFVTYTKGQRGFDPVMLEPSERQVLTDISSISHNSIQSRDSSRKVSGLIRKQGQHDGCRPQEIGNRENYRPESVGKPLKRDGSNCKISELSLKLDNLEINSKTSVKDHPIMSPQLESPREVQFKSMQDQSHEKPQSLIFTPGPESQQSAGKLVRNLPSSSSQHDSVEKQTVISSDSSITKLAKRAQPLLIKRPPQLPYVPSQAQPTETQKVGMIKNLRNGVQTQNALSLSKDTMSSSFVHQSKESHQLQQEPIFVQHTPRSGKERFNLDSIVASLEGAQTSQFDSKLEMLQNGSQGSWQASNDNLPKFKEILKDEIYYAAKGKLKEAEEHLYQTNKSESAHSATSNYIQKHYPQTQNSQSDFNTKLEFSSYCSSSHSLATLQKTIQPRKVSFCGNVDVFILEDYDEAKSRQDSINKVEESLEDMYNRYFGGKPTENEGEDQRDEEEGGSEDSGPYMDSYDDVTDMGSDIWSSALEAVMRIQNQELRDEGKPEVNLLSDMPLQKFEVLLEREFAALRLDKLELETKEEEAIELKETIHELKYETDLLQNEITQLSHVEVELGIKPKTEEDTMIEPEDDDETLSRSDNEVLETPQVEQPKIEISDEATSFEDQWNKLQEQMMHSQIELQEGLKSLQEKEICEMTDDSDIERDAQQLEAFYSGMVKSKKRQSSKKRRTLPPIPKAPKRKQVPEPMIDLPKQMEDQQQSPGDSEITMFNSEKVHEMDQLLSNEKRDLKAVSQFSSARRERKKEGSVPKRQKSLRRLREPLSESITNDEEKPKMPKLACIQKNRALRNSKSNIPNLSRPDMTPVSPKREPESTQQAKQLDFKALDSRSIFQAYEAKFEQIENEIKSLNRPLQSYAEIPTPKSSVRQSNPTLHEPTNTIHPFTEDQPSEYGYQQPDLQACSRKSSIMKIGSFLKDTEPEEEKVQTIPDYTLTESVDLERRNESIEGRQMTPSFTRRIDDNFSGHCEPIPMKRHSTQQW